MPSDIFMKYTSGSSSSTWRKMTNTFMKYTSGTSSSAWRTATNIWAYFNSGWTRVWPLSGVFNVTSPYITTSSGSTTPLYGVDGVRRIGTTVWGKNGTWNANGWTINSYQYRWRAYSSSTISDLNLDSQTSLATYSSAVSLSIPASYDRKYLSFFIQANSSGGTAYNGYAESGTEYGGIQIVRSSPLNLTTSLSSYSPQEGSQLTYSSTWDETDRYAAESNRTTINWYKNLSNSTTGGTLVGSGTTYTPTSSDLNNYLYVVETRYNSGSDYDLGSSTGVEAKIITTSTVVVGLTPPTSVSVASVSRYSNTETLVTLNHSGGSGPYYQMYWVNSSTTPVTTSYDAASNTSSTSISDLISVSNNYTAYFYVRSSSQNIATTFTFGSATAGTYSAYSNLSPQPSYTFTHPSGSISVSPSSGTAGSTTFSVSPSISSSPSPNITYEWQYFEGGMIGWVTIATGTTYSPPSNYVSLYGTQLRCYATANNGVSSSQGVQSFNTASTLSVSAPVSAPTNATIPTLSPTSIAIGTQLSAGIGTWNNSPTSYDIRIYRGTANVATFETLVASRTGSSTANLTYTVTQADYDSGQRYFRTFVDASNTGGSSGLVAGQERGPITTPSYTITWNANGGSVSPELNTVNSGTSVAAPTPTRSGYTFLYWRDTISGDYTYQINPGGSWTVTSNITFYARWQASATTPSTPGTPTLTYIPSQNTASNWAYSATWGASTGTGTIQYQLDCLGSSGGTGTKGLYSTNNTGGSSTPFFLSRTNNTWQVRVRATNDGGSTWSSYSAFSNSA